MTSITPSSIWVMQLGAAAQTQSAVDWITANSSDDMAKSLGIKKSAILRDFIANGTAIAGAFAGIAQTQIDGSAKLAAQAAITRAQTETAKKIDALAVDEGGNVNAIARVDLANGATVDMVANTLIMPNGITYDLMTGRKLDITV